jgi:prepilin-type N-terminal cleavage/methylation domain-containing protein
MLKCNRSGFTMPELLMTAGILSYALAMVLATYITSVALNQASRNLTIAVSHAEYILEDIRNTSFSTVATSVTAGTWNWNAAAVTARGLGALNNESTSVTSSGTNPLDIAVTISWNDLNSRARTRTIRTSITG